MTAIIKAALIYRIKEIIKVTETKSNNDPEYYEGMIDGLLIALNIIKNEF